MSCEDTTSDSQASPDGPATAGKPAVLVVEDDALVRLDVAEELRAHGCTVIEAATAEEARDLVDAMPDIDLVLTDVQMPGSMDGVALARHIVQERPKTKVVIISAAWSPGPDAPSVAAVLHKPMPSVAIARVVDQLINSHRP